MIFIAVRNGAERNCIIKILSQFSIDVNTSHMQSSDSRTHKRWVHTPPVKMFCSRTQITSFKCHATFYGPYWHLQRVDNHTYIHIIFTSFYVTHNFYSTNCIGYAWYQIIKGICMYLITYVHSTVDLIISHYSSKRIHERFKCKYWMHKFTAPGVTIPQTNFPTPVLARLISLPSLRLFPSFLATPFP